MNLSNLPEEMPWDILRRDVVGLIKILEAELKVANGQREQYVVSGEQAMKFIATGYANGIIMAIAEAKKLLIPAAAKNEAGK